MIAGLKEVIERKGLFWALYSDRGSHFLAGAEGERQLDNHRRTQVRQALHELGVHMIPDYSPQAHGRSERNFSIWQGRLRRSYGCVNGARWRRRTGFCGKSTSPSSTAVLGSRPKRPGNAFVPCRSRDLERIFSLQFERSVNRDNTVTFRNLSLQIERVRGRATLTGCQVVVHQHLNEP